MTTAIFVAKSTPEYEWIQPTSGHDMDAVFQLDGSPRSHSWDPIPMRTLRRLDRRGPRLLPADVPWLGEHALVFRNTAYQAVGSVLASSGEFLELELKRSKEPVWLFNVCRVVDGLDEAHSDLDRFPSSGRIMDVNRHAFQPRAVRDATAFRVPQLRTLFFSSRVVEAVEAAGLVGVSFRQVWSE